MLSNRCLVLPAVVKQQQEEISRNHVPSLFAVSVYNLNRWTDNPFFPRWYDTCRGDVNGIMRLNGALLPHLTGKV